MSMKLYRVDCELAWEVLVLAEDEEHARTLVKKHKWAQEELRNNGLECDTQISRGIEITTVEQIPDCWEGTPVYSEEQTDMSPERWLEESQS